MSFAPAGQERKRKRKNSLVAGKGKEEHFGLPSEKKRKPAYLALEEPFS